MVIPSRALAGVAFTALVVAATTGACRSAAPAANAIAPDADADPATAASATTSARDTTAAASDVSRALPYDLAADLSARTDAARALLSSPSAPARVESGVFLFVSAPHADAYTDAATKLTRTAVADYFAGERFTVRPDRAVTVFVFPDATSYQAFCRRRYGGPCESPFGFYRPGEREIAFDASRGVSTITHEIVHPLLAADFVEAPAWFDEGLASLFEAPLMPRPGIIHGDWNWRFDHLRDSLRSPAVAPSVRLDTLFGMTTADFRGGDAPLHYAMARYACMWLDSRDELWPFYRAWRDGIARDPSGDRAFARVVGETPMEANAEWVAWLDRRR